jgi:hypothetical protein
MEEEKNPPHPYSFVVWQALWLIMLIGDASSSSRRREKKHAIFFSFFFKYFLGLFLNDDGPGRGWRRT